MLSAPDAQVLWEQNGAAAGARTQAGEHYSASSQSRAQRAEQSIYSSECGCSACMHARVEGMGANKHQVVSTWRSYVVTLRYPSTAAMPRTPCNTQQCCAVLCCAYHVHVRLRTGREGLRAQVNAPRPTHASYSCLHAATGVVEQGITVLCLVQAHSWAQACTQQCGTIIQRCW